MFGFLNRNKSQSQQNESTANSNDSSSDNSKKLVSDDSVNDAKKNLYDSIILKRIDIVVSIMNEWLRAKANSDDSVKYFYNSNYCENGTTSPLLVAFYMKERDLIRTLLNFGADPGLADLKTKKCLVELINESYGLDENQHLQMKQLLSDCFMQSIVQNNIKIVRQYLTAGFDLNSTSQFAIGNNNDNNKKLISLPDNNTYLHWAVMYSSEPIVRLLLENGSNVNAVNKYGATSLHECIAKKVTNETKTDQLHMVETLLIYKADPINIKGTSGVYKDMNALDMAMNNKTDSDVYNLMRDFLQDVSSTSSSSLPNSPLSKAGLERQISSGSVIINDSPPKTQTPNTTPTTNNITHSLDMLAKNESSNSNLKTLNRGSTSDLEPIPSWSQVSVNSNQNLNTSSSIRSLLWPHPQHLNLISVKKEDSFDLDDIRAQNMFIYFKPPHTFTYMDIVNKLVTSFSEINFHCIHKPIESPYVSVTIDKTLFSRDNQYSILVTKSKIEINAIDSVALQYAFFTFIQLCKIFKNQSIPSLRIIDYSDVKYRSVLLDFSQGFYFKYETLLAILQMVAFYKINQVHLYVKFSSLPPVSEKKQWYHCINHNWFGLMKFCEEVNLQLVPSIDITNDVAELDDVLVQIKEYLDLFKGFKFLNIGPRLSSLLTCIENKNPFSLDSNQFMMLCSYLYHNGDAETFAELEKFDKYILMEYGLKVGTKFESKSMNLYKSGQPFYYCIGSANWNSFLGCPDGCLHNLYDAIKRQREDLPIGILMCNFTGTINKNPFATNLNSMIMFAGSSWNTNITLEETKKNLPSVLLKHGMISNSDGSLGISIFELGHIETYLSMIVNNSKDFNELPYDEGSIFTRLINNPDDLDLDNLDKHLFKKVLLGLRAENSKLKSLMKTNTNYLFREISVSTEICLNLFKFLVTLYNTGTRQHQAVNKAVGLNVINIGVSNLSQTVRTDLANKLIILKEEYKTVLQKIYYEESVDEYIETYYTKLIDKLLIDQNDLNLADLIKYKKIETDRNKLRSISTSSFYSNYYINNSSLDDDDINSHLVFKK